MTKNGVYLDYCATAPLRPEARGAMLAAYETGGNASSIHCFGRRARLLVEDARGVLADAVGGDVEEIVFTSGGTECNALALNGYGVGAEAFLVSASVHDSVMKSAIQAAQGRRAGGGSVPRELVVLPVTASGEIDLDVLAEVLARVKGVPFVSVEWVNNETGVIQPVGEIVALVRSCGGIVHVDAVQALGRVALDGLCGDARPDLLSLSAHKIGGPQGVGALVVRDGLLRRDGFVSVPLFSGGGQEKGRRAGTENVAGIAGFSAAVTCAVAELAYVNQWRGWQRDFEARLLAVEGARIVGSDAPRVSCVTCVVCPVVKADIMLMRLDMAGIAVSSGSACSSGKVGTSSVLRAMGVDGALQRSAVRVSFGWETEPDELVRCAQSWTEAALSVMD